MRANYESLTPTPTDRLLAEKSELVCPVFGDFVISSIQHEYAQQKLFQ